MVTQLPSLDKRDVVFVSHANPEDNAFATWLALRLIREGYRVWCDVVRLNGGDDFWRDIEKSIRDRARKCIFVVSKASNQKQGTLQELSVASGVARQLGDSSFIIPIKIDDLPYAEHNIQINRLIALPFNLGWADGFGQLLSALDDDGVPRVELKGPSVVASWWNSNRLNRNILKRTPETLCTNWFPLRHLPKRLWFWTIPESSELPDVFPYPTYRSGNRLFSFANAESLTDESNSPTGGTGRSFKFSLKHDPPRSTGLLRHEVITAVKQLLCDAWLAMAEQHSLPIYQLSSRRKSLWFPDGHVKDNTVYFDGTDGKKARRDLCGYLTVRKSNGDTFKRYWHFGLEAVPILYPSPVLALKYHVVFTHDGKTIAGDAKYQHRARRGQCRLWWNDKWRDLMLAAVSCLTEGNSLLPLCMSPDSETAMEWRPTKYESPVSYDDAQIRITPTEEICESDDEHAEETILA
jgi:TIR domain